MSDDRELDGTLELAGRITTASNATFVGRIDDVAVVYKPVAGEKPLWDFPDGSLAGREVAAYLVSESFGWNVVPRTWLRDGPLGPGMVQLWREPDPEQSAVDLVPSDALPVDGWRVVFDGFDGDDRTRPPSSTRNSLALRRMAVFDVVVNNADRKGAHILEMPGGHRHGVDHGLTFHVEHKLRTVLWGWLGDELNDTELDALDRVGIELGAGLGVELAQHLDPLEIAALARRCERLRSEAGSPHRTAKCRRYPGRCSRRNGSVPVAPATAEHAVELAARGCLADGAAARTKVGRDDGGTQIVQLRSDDRAPDATSHRVDEPGQTRIVAESEEGRLRTQPHRVVQLPKPPWRSSPDAAGN